MVSALDPNNSFIKSCGVHVMIQLFNIVYRLDIGQGKVRIGVLSFDSDVNGNESLSLSASVDYDAVSNSVQAQNGGPGTGKYLNCKKTILNCKSFLKT